MKNIIVSRIKLKSDIYSIFVKAACLQMHGNFHIKVKYFEVNKESNLHIVNGTCSPGI
jgi:hypothetical protein